MSAALRLPSPAPRPRRPFLVADLLCGAGGSSTGALQAIEAAGLSMELVAVNHWSTAIATHAANHPHARHYVQDIATVRPHLLVPEGRLDLLMASPTCTHHSRARGGKPTSDQQRADPWHVIPWLTELRVATLLIENVPEFLDWGPVDTRNFRPVRSRRGEYFKAWVATIEALGYRVEWRILNAADFGEATTRKRFYLIAVPKRRRIVWPDPTHSRDGAGTLFGGARRWRPAREIIDWSIPGRSIYDRPRPLAPATLRRILAGITRFDWPAPYIVTLRNHMAARGIDEPLPTVSAGGTHHGIAVPIILPQRSTEPPTRDVDAPIGTVTTVARVGLISPYYGSGSGETCTNTDSPLPTCTAKARFGLVMPVTHDDGSNRARPLDEPIATVTGANRGELALVDGGRDWDILFRMLAPHELAAAMGFDNYRFTGTKTDITRQIGNAVSVRQARALVAAILQGESS